MDYSIVLFSPICLFFFLGLEQGHESLPFGPIFTSGKHAISGGPDAGENVYDRPYVHERPYVYERTHARHDVWPGRDARIRIFRSRANATACSAILHRLLSTARQRGVHTTGFRCKTSVTVSSGCGMFPRDPVPMSPLVPGQQQMELLRCTARWPLQPPCVNKARGCAWTIDAPRLTDPLCSE